MKILVTAGPTREPLDPVRFLSNRSSGRMGYAIARALLAQGHEVVLVSGPVAIKPPVGAHLEGVETAREMLAACRQHWPDCDALYAVAAVADWRPAKVQRGKIKRAQDAPQLAMVANPDIVQTLARTKKCRLVVGFALETSGGAREALRKLRQKKLDFVVLNGPEVQDATYGALRLLAADGQEIQLGPASKAALARSLVRKTLTA